MSEVKRPARSSRLALAGVGAQTAVYQAQHHLALRDGRRSIDPEWLSAGGEAQPRQGVGGALAPERMGSVAPPPRPIDCAGPRSQGGRRAGPPPVLGRPPDRARKGDDK